MVFRFLRDKRRRRASEQEFPAAWEAILRDSVHIFSCLPPDDQDELRKHILVFIDEKNFEGCGGLELTDAMRVIVAANACVLLLHREHDYYPTTQSILVYPDQFVVDVVEYGPDGVVSEYADARAGEAWDTGPVVVSWKDVEDSIAHPSDGYNVVMHEFAHQLDMENGAVDGMPGLTSSSDIREWNEVFTEAFRRFTRRVDDGRRTAMDEYAAEAPSEFFAVAVEAFFETPHDVREGYPRVYDLLRAYFDQDPASWPCYGP